MSNTRYDVLVIGAGPAGALTARELAANGVRVALIEASRYDHHRVGEILAAYACRRLQSLGLGSLVEAGAARPCEGVLSAWGSDELLASVALKSPFGAGAIVDRSRFDAALAAAAEDAGATRRWPARAVGIAKDAAGFRCTIVRPGGARESLTIDWLVDATGRRISAAIALGGARVVCDRLTGLCRRLSPAEGGADAWRNVGLIEAVDDGYWYTAPLPEGRIVAVFLSDADADNTRFRAEALWGSALGKSRHTASRVESCRAATKVFRCDARSQYAVAPSCSRLLIVGDASVAFDPLSADGVARAIDSACDAAESILANRDDAVERATLRYRRFASYERERGANYSLERRYDHRFWRRRRAPERGLIGLDPRARLQAVGDATAEAVARAEALLGMDNVDKLLSVVNAQPGIEANGALRQVRRTSHRELSAEQWIFGLQALLEDSAVRAAEGEH